MARPITQRRITRADLALDPPVEGIVVKPLPLWSPPRGANYSARKSRIPQEFSPHIKNLLIDKGVIKSRGGVGVLGGAPASGDPVAVIDFVTSSGTRYTFRFRTNGVDIYSRVTSTWVAIAGLVLGATTADMITVTAWADKLLFSNGLNGIIEIDPITATYFKIPGAPSALHLTTFGGRVIATSATLPYRVQWCVKNNNRDWTGPGSGYEDLFGAPGGIVDAAMGTFPITDEIAFLVRASSVWQMSLTGSVDAPFRFSRMFDMVGSRSRHAIARVPGGIAMLGTDDVYLISPDGPQSIGEAIKDRLFPNLRAAPLAFAGYDRFRKACRFAVMEGSQTGLNVVWDYSIIDKSWTRLEYPFKIRSVSFTEYAKGFLTADQLTGTADSLTGIADELGITGYDRGFNMVMAESSKLSVREDSTLSQDVSSAGAAIDSEIEIQTGVLHASGTGQKTQIQSLSLELEADEAQTLIAEFSDNDATTWNSWSQAAIVSQVKRQLKHLGLGQGQTIERDNLSLRLRSTKLGKLRILSAVPFVQTGAPIR